MQTIRTNLKINASTQYTNHNYTSMCLFNGVVLGAGPDGLFKTCCGDDDNNTDIDAYFILSQTDLGKPTTKRARFFYLGMQCDGVVQVTMTGDDRNTMGPYNVTAVLTEGSQSRRVTNTSNTKFVYETVKVNNVEGSFFSIDSIKANILDVGYSI